MQVIYPMKQLTLLEFTPKDFHFARCMAARAGRTDENFVYTSTSAINGVEYLSRDNEDKNKFAIIKTKELGFLLIKDLADLKATDLKSVEDKCMANS